MSTPDELSLIQMIHDRRHEVLSLTREVQKKLPKQASQRIPRMMRRRAASHQPKRIPKACRVKFLQSNQDKGSKAKERKRRIMKKHTSPLVIDRSIRKRNRDPSRTCLHVYHAKRFHMGEMFAETEFPVKVPLYNCTKNQRNLWRRAKSNNCFYYMTPIMQTFLVMGKESLLKELPVDQGKDHSHHHIISYGKLIAPIEVIAVPDEDDSSRILVSCHRSAVPSLTDWMHERGIPVSDDTHDYEERIRLVGPQAIARIKQDLSIELVFPEDGSCTTITSSGMMFVKGSIGDRPFVDILLSYKSCKTIWQSLVRNRSHLVGGYHNLRMLHFNAGQSFFPDFGYPDFGGDAPVTVCRDADLREFQQKAENPSLRLQQMEIKLKDILKQSPGALIPVCVVSQGRGNVRIGSRVLLTQDGDASAAAAVEFGAFCLSKGCEKGIACLPVESLIELVRRTAADEGSQHELRCWIRNPLSDTLRPVDVFIL